MMNQEKLSTSNENEESAQEFKEYISDFFTFRNVLLCTIILGIIILLFSFLIK